MKPNSHFVKTVLTMLGVAIVQQVDASMVNSDHARVMSDSMTSEAKEFLADAFGDADDAGEPVIKGIAGSGLENSTLEDRYLIEKIYSSQGRRLEFKQMVVTAHPTAAAVHRKNREQQEHQSAHRQQRPVHQGAQLSLATS